MGMAVLESTVMLMIIIKRRIIMDPIISMNIVYSGFRPILCICQWEKRSWNSLMEQSWN